MILFYLDVNDGIVTLSDHILNPKEHFYSLLFILFARNYSISVVESNKNKRLPRLQISHNHVNRPIKVVESGGVN